jgi:DNA-directed RNA polymerase specialized sigma24 family protein
MDEASIDLGAQLAVDRQGAIGEIYAALGTTVLSYLQRLVGRDDAEDVLQRVFYEVWRHNGRYDPSRSLPEEQREVLVLAYFGGYTQSEISKRLELPLGTVKARTFRGLRRLAKLLNP